MEVGQVLDEVVLQGSTSEWLWSSAINAGEEIALLANAVMLNREALQ